MSPRPRRGTVPGFTGKGPLVAATDASLKNRSAGIAYVVSDGRWGLRGRVSERYLDPTGRSTVLVAELRAIALLLEDCGEPHPVTLLTDSQAAAGYLRSWQTGDITRMPEGYNLRLRAGGQPATLARLAAQMYGWHRTLAVEHVHGHAGHPLNEAAHSLASIARRQLPAEDARQRAGGLVGAFLPAWHRAAGGEAV